LPIFGLSARKTVLISLIWGGNQTSIGCAASDQDILEESGAALPSRPFPRRRDFPLSSSCAKKMCAAACLRMAGGLDVGNLAVFFISGDRLGIVSLRMILMTLLSG